MLQLIRDRAQGILVWIIVGLIIITFALFGLSSYLTGVSKTNVASVNGVDITETELVNAYQNYQERLQQMLGDNYRPDLFNEESMRRQVLDGLITQELINQKLDDANFNPAPEQVISYLKGMEAFQENGEFSPERYRQTLGYQGLQSDQFELQIAQEIAARQLRNGVTHTGFATQAELETYARLQNQERDIAYMQFNKRAYEQKVTLDEAEIESYYNQHKAQFSTPEQVSIVYIELNLETAAAQYEVSEADIQQYYQQHIANYVRQPEQRQARHILVKVEKDVDEQAARQRAEELRARLKQGEAFDKLAKEHSQDIGSAQQGGDLGFFGRGVMDKAFEEAAFALKKGEVSQPVRSSFGYHLIKLDDIREEQRQSLAEVRAVIKKDLQIQQAEQTFYEDIDKLNNLSYEIPDAIEPVAEQLGLQVKKSPLFGRSGIPGQQGLLANPKVISAAFTDEVLHQGKNSEPVELSDTHFVVLRRNEYKPASELPLEQVKTTLVSRLQSEKAIKQMAALAKEARQRIQAGEPGEAVARAYAVKWRKPGYITRSAADSKAVLSNQIREEAFRMVKPATAQPSTTVVPLSGGDSAVVALYAVRDGKPESEPAKLKSTRSTLSSASGNEAYSAMLKNLWVHADITVNLKTEQE